MTERQRYVGFLGVTGKSFAIRPAKPNLQHAVRSTIPSVVWNATTKEWLFDAEHRPAASRLADQLPLRILPEARKMAGLKPGKPIVKPELVPETAWFSNPRLLLPNEVWKSLAFQSRKAAGNCCEYCGRRGSKWPTECHELWSYDDDSATQTLERLVSLCPSCHRSYHLGHANTEGELEEALEYLAFVNGWSLEMAYEAYDECADRFRERSQKRWALNADKLRDYGVEPLTWPTPDERAAMAAQGLRRQQMKKLDAMLNDSNAIRSGGTGEEADIDISALLRDSRLSGESDAVDRRDVTAASTPEPVVVDLKHHENERPARGRVARLFRRH